MMVREDVEIHLHAPQTKTEHFWPCVYGQAVILKNCITVMKHLDYETTWFTQLPTMSTQALEVIPPFSVITGPPEYHDIAAQIITDPPPCFTVGTRHSEL